MMAALHREMRGHEIVATQRIELDRYQGGSACNESIEHDGHLAGGTAQDQSGETGDLEPSDLCYDIDGIVQVHRMASKGLFDYLYLACQTCVINAGTSTGDGRGRLFRHDGRDCRTGCGIADSHISGPKKIYPLAGGLLSQ